MSALEDVREWISFSDPDELRTWVFDVTFLRSNYRCIFGAGCKGVLNEDATELEQGCCSYGAHFVDEADVANIVRHFVRLEPHHMQFYDEAVRAGFLDSGFEDDGTEATVTRLVDDACIFLNRPGSAQGAGCALHVAALEAGERPLDWKPNVCWQVPVRLEHSTDENGHVTSRLRDWKRRDWGKGGDEFHWWCTDTPATGDGTSGDGTSGTSGQGLSGQGEAYIGDQPVYRSARDEIIELVGAPIYDLLVEALEQPRGPELPTPVSLRPR